MTLNSISVVRESDDDSEKVWMVHSYSPWAGGSFLRVRPDQKHHFCLVSVHAPLSLKSRKCGCEIRVACDSAIQYPGWFRSHHLSLVLFINVLKF